MMFNVVTIFHAKGPFIALIWAHEIVYASFIHICMWLPIIMGYDSVDRQNLIAENVIGIVLQFGTNRYIYHFCVNSILFQP